MRRIADLSRSRMMWFDGAALFCLTKPANESAALPLPAAASVVTVVTNRLNPGLLYSLPTQLNPQSRLFISTTWLIGLSLLGSQIKSCLFVVS